MDWTVPRFYTPSMHTVHDLHSALRRYWGYEEFRPLQERIVRSLMEGHDTCVVMPTGGGKSLCYQLPAAMLTERTAVVVSPLIALMQDQVAALTQIGISSALLNSSLSVAQQSRVMQQAGAGEYRLLYLSPERLARPETIEWLQRVPISLFAIDEAHCISEWGHEFRPDYRQLSCLRLQFPDRPIAAFTASATQRVRHDIIHQLQLRDPHKYIASFYRSNLRYVVRACDGRSQMNLLVRALRDYESGNIIVYAPTIAMAESTVAFLQEAGIPAIAYHGQMEAEDRRRNQELWMADEVRVLVGTIAFGLGINKAAVRAVIHLSLPKSIEQYYQEAGRAGRDGAPADCVMLWQKRDAGLLAYFIGQIVDPAEKQRAWQRYHEIRGFVESKNCRHRQICTHFGENPKWETCDACDICGSEPDWLSEPVDVVGKSPQKSKSRPSGVARRLDAHGSPQPIAMEVDPNLREFLREWRRETAKDQRVPAFVVLHDTTLDEICRTRPNSIGALLRVHGIGERKAEVYGKGILEALNRFRGGARAVRA
jgi:ATP-dependent DNA helicase RecQ